MENENKVNREGYVVSDDNNVFDCRMIIAAGKYGDLGLHVTYKGKRPVLHLFDTTDTRNQFFYEIRHILWTRS